MSVEWLLVLAFVAGLLVGLVGVVVGVCLLGALEANAPPSDRLERLRKL